MFLKEDYVYRLVVSKSEFITYLRRCKNEQEYKDFLAEIKKKHYDATHCCSAFYSLNFQKSNDDGEPAKTAGIPILNALQSEKMQEIAAVVVRYFGGIKLGASGLIRTYRQATVLAIQNASKVIEETYPVYQIICDYELANKLIIFLRRNVYDMNLDYQEEVKIEYVSAKSYQKELENIARNKLTIQKIKEVVIQKEV